VVNVAGQTWPLGAKSGGYIVQRRGGVSEPLAETGRIWPDFAARLAENLTIIPPDKYA
jgi:hypothetical protein